MLKSIMVAGALLAGAAELPAHAQDMRAQMTCGPGGYGANCDRSGYGGGAYSRYCPPGYFPHSFPTGNGIRCEAVNGDDHFDSPF